MSTRRADEPPTTHDVIHRMRMNEAPPADPGGSLTQERIDVLRWRALHYGPTRSPFAYTPSHADALCDALDEVERLREALTLSATEGVMLARVARERAWGEVLKVAWGGAPSWLTEYVERGTAAELQADRARVAAVFCERKVRWYCHDVAPRQYDATSLTAARNVLAMLRGSP